MANKNLPALLLEKFGIYSTTTPQTQPTVHSSNELKVTSWMMKTFGIGPEDLDSGISADHLADIVVQFNSAAE